MTKTHHGGCLCGAVRFHVDGAPKWAGHCHCHDCRGITGAPFTTFAGFVAAAVVFAGRDAAIPVAPTPVGGDLMFYQSSPGTRRGFCGRCGTPLYYASERWPDEIHLYLASFDDPTWVEPGFHVYLQDKLPWFKLGDGLPGYQQTSGG